MSEFLPPLKSSVFRMLVRFTLVVAVAYGVHLLMNWVLVKAESLSPGSQTVMLTSLLVLLLLAYAILIAVPFVPGIEVGLSLIVIRGPSIALYVYLATVFGLTLAYLIGRYLPYSWLHRLLLDLRLVRAGRLLDRIKAFSPAQRLEVLRERLPRRLGPLLVRWRYVALAILINVPGNMLIGGGGGISMIAGLSRVFAPLATIFTIALAVSPFPLLVWFFGIELFA